MDYFELDEVVQLVVKNALKDLNLPVSNSHEKNMASLKNLFKSEKHFKKFIKENLMRVVDGLMQRNVLKDEKRQMKK